MSTAKSHNHLIIIIIFIILKKGTKLNIPCILSGRNWTSEWGKEMVAFISELENEWWLI